MDDPANILRLPSFLYTGDYVENEDIIPLTSDASQEASANACISYSDDHIATLNNIRVYVAVEKFDIQPLRQLALERTMERIPWDGLSGILMEVVRTVLPHDTELRTAIAEHLITVAAYSSLDEDDFPVIKECGIQGMAVTTRALQKIKKAKEKSAAWKERYEKEREKMLKAEKYLGEVRVESLGSFANSRKYSD